MKFESSADLGWDRDIAGVVVLVALLNHVVGVDLDDEVVGGAVLATARG